MNKACPNDSFPLSSIDSLVDNASGCRLLSFLDALLGITRFVCTRRTRVRQPLWLRSPVNVTKSCPLALKMLAQPIKG